MTATFQKVNETGRSSGKLDRKHWRYICPPEGEPWVWLTIELLESPAWQAMSVNTRRLIDRLLIEHSHHGGQANGQLIVTHKQFIEYGLMGDAIRPAIDEAEFLGLVRSERGGRWAETNRPSIYTLTWIGDHTGASPTNKWKGKTQEQIDQWKEGRAKRRKAKREYRKNRK